MSSEIESPFGNFCRTCMNQDNDADSEFQSIFDTIPNTDQPISDLLNILGDCNTADSMPNRICKTCVTRIGDAHELLQIWLRTKSKYRQLTEKRKYPVDCVAPSNSLLDATVEESDPLTEDNCMPGENVEADGNEDPTEISLYSDDDFNWPSDEEKDALSDEPNNETFECDICHTNFKNSRGLSNHIYWKHQNKDGLVCGTCGQTFRKLGPFNRHKLKHKREGKEQKEEEHSEAQQESSLMQSEEGTSASQCRKPQKNKTCEICHKVFAYIGNLKLHKLLHTGERKYLCKECGKSFRCPTDLAAHEQRHAGVKQYECPLCPKKFVDRGNLSAHKRIHSDSKPHVCDVCGAAFKFPGVLKKHKLYHREKTVKCEQCDMRFYIVGAMRRHMLIHTGEKPYKCKYCDRAFNQSNDLMKHMRNHVGENVYRCELCPMGFPLQKEMRKHFALHKNDNEASRKKNLEALAEYERNLSQQIKSKKEIQV